MWLIDRDTDGGGPRIALPAPLREALVRWYVGQGSPGDEAAGITLVQNARIGAKWIACDCLAVDEPPPILTPAFLSEAETYYLRRLTSAKRPDHRADCPFFRDQVTHRISEVRSRETPAAPPEGFFEVLRPAPSQLAQQPESDGSDDRTRHASVPRLARLLWRLLAVAGTTRAFPLSDGAEEPSIKREFDALVKAGSRIEIAPGIELSRAFWTHADALHSRRAYAVLRRLSRDWPPGHAPQAFFALFSHQITGHVIATADNRPVRVANRVQSPSVRGNLVRGPFLVIVVAGQYPEARGYAPLRAYAQPIYSGQRFIPVDSEFERSLLRELLAIQRNLHRHGIDAAIEKPVFDILTPLGPARPDFLIEARSRITGEIKRLAIDTIDHGDDDHDGSSTSGHSRLREIAPLLCLSSGDLVPGRVARKVAAALDL
ncbi:hypothetical protein [Sphingomonas paucimobilis]|uniref:Uncharacterized protein n=1 Tax=Sphingomonas paucimobilis TaxID=13689 RepID=A0A7Y2KNC7_SPHPI|nr:hypothetical protein [Sphingomonas paucimobilis]NNG57154.1 hypothetical protein [Sphingomonas paucimobilis]